MKYILRSEKNYLLDLYPKNPTRLSCAVPDVFLSEPILWQKESSSRVCSLEKLRPEELIARYLIDAGVSQKHQVFTMLWELSKTISQPPVEYETPQNTMLKTNKNMQPMVTEYEQKMDYILKKIHNITQAQQIEKNYSMRWSASPKSHTTNIHSLEELEPFELPMHIQSNFENAVNMPQIVDAIINTNEEANGYIDIYGLELQDITNLTDKINSFSTLVEKQQGAIEDIVDVIEKEFKAMNFNFLEDPEGYLIDWNYLLCHFQLKSEAQEELDYWQALTQENNLLKTSLAPDQLVSSLKNFYTCDKFKDMASVFVAAECDEDTRELNVLSFEDGKLYLSKNVDEVLGVFYSAGAVMNCFGKNYKDTNQILYAMEYKNGVLASIVAQHTLDKKNKKKNDRYIAANFDEIDATVQANLSKFLIDKALRSDRIDATDNNQQKKKVIKI